MLTHPDYPRLEEIDAWCAALLRESDAIPLSAECSAFPPTPFSIRNLPAVQFVRFSRPESPDWFGIWQPVLGGGPAPLLVHVPGYGAEMSLHPQLVAAGYNVLHINPRGYCRPQGLDESKRHKGVWPVLPETVLSGGKRGYADWLTDALVSVRWALQQPQVQPTRLATFGTSQGGGGALLLASLLQKRHCKACCADEPFLTGFFLMHGRGNVGAYNIAFEPLNTLTEPLQQRAGWHGLGLIDTMSHSHRLTMPTLLTAGDLDMVCPADTIRALFDRLPGTRSYVEMAGQAHGYTAPFGELVRAWCAIHV